jgi:uncharacterized RDD family membrane protein YckC
MDRSTVVVERLPLRASISAGLQGHRAGLVSRFLAAVVDLVVIIALLGAVYAAVAGIAFLLDPRDFNWPTNLGWTVPVVGAVIALPYLTLGWATNGRTVGDALFGLRVVTHRGDRVRVPRAILRAAFCLVFPLGLFWIPFSRSRRSVQDLVLRTSVNYDWASQPGRPG